MDVVDTDSARIDAALEGVSEESALDDEADDLSGLAGGLEAVTAGEAGVAIGRRASGGREPRPG